MKLAHTTIIAILALSTFVIADDHEKTDDHKTSQPALTAILTPTEGNVTDGYIVLTQTKEGVHIKARIRGLKPSASHAFHIHEFGDVSKTDGTSAGGHFNPDGHKHGLPLTDDEFHAGDLGNLMADEKGFAEMNLTFKGITLTEGTHAVIGRSFVIHQSVDDGGQPTGNAGPRIAIGVIGYANPETLDKGEQP